jgi:hypothetical protein
MAKSAIQIRAEKLAAEFRASKRPALVVEFAGVPKAGKTSTLNHVYAFLRRCGFRCEVVVERASVCPITDKKHFNFNIWTACTTLSQLLEKTQSPPRENDPEILFLDRGVFDAICWLSLLEKLGRITPNDRKKADDFFLIDDWTTRVSGVIAMSTKPEDALKREQGLLPIEGPGGSINPIVLKQMQSVIKERTRELKAQFRIFEVDTSAKQYADKPQQTCETVAHKILDWITESIEEKILSAAKSVLPSLQEKFVVSSVEAQKLIETFERKGDFQPRKKVEANLN